MALAVLKHQGMATVESLTEHFGSKIGHEPGCRQPSPVKDSSTHLRYLQKQLPNEPYRLWAAARAGRWLAAAATERWLKRLKGVQLASAPKTG